MRRRAVRMGKSSSVEIVKLIAYLRVAIGVGFLFAPKTMVRMWTKEEATLTGRLAARGLGGRDLALGLGALLAMRRGGHVRGWIEAGAIADASDALGVLSEGELDPARQALFFATAAGSAGLGVRLARTALPSP